MSDFVIINRYAQAYFNIGERENKLDKLQQSLKDAIEIFYKREEIFGYLIDPVKRKTRKYTFIDNFKESLEPETLEFIKVLIRYERINYLFNINERLQQIIYREKNKLLGKLITVTKLNKELKKKIEDKLSERLKKEVFLQDKIDQTILGGFRIEVGSYSVDASIKTRLEKLKI